jgi:methionyl-tRNA formyltransferase
MRVVFIGKNHEFSLLSLRAIQTHHEIVGIVESGPRGSNPKASPPARSWRGLLGLAKPQGMKCLAQDMRLPHFLMTRKTVQDLPAFLQPLSPEVLCVASLSQLLSKAVLLIPRHGALNLHPSLLPKYHGPFPWFWQYHDFGNEWGATIHQIDEGQDTGPILKQQPVSIQIGTDVIEAIRIVGTVGAKLFVEALEEIANGTSTAKPQPTHQFPKARIVERHERFIDWQTWPIERVWHFMRGTYPWHDAVEYPQLGKSTVVWKTDGYEKCAVQSKPGEVLKDERGYFVVHKDGKIRLSFQHSTRSLGASLRNLLRSQS